VWHAAISKPAIVGYTCVVVGGGAWMGMPESPGAKPGPQVYLPPEAIAGLPAGVAFLPAGAEIISPAGEAVLGTTIGFSSPPTEMTPSSPLTRLPQAPSSPRQPVSEPSSLLLLVGALALLRALRSL
jgi:hypothetical protein